MVSFKLFAGTNVGLRENNEDNFTVCPDLNKNEWIVPADYQQVIQLGYRGCVMVVADGMGGQNAGEVASAIAIDTVQDMFSPNHMSTDVFAKSDTIKSFLKKVILECDVRIKKRAAEDPSTDGMGSTIVIAWLIDCKMYIAWLGDSRAYSFVRNKGIARLSKDHSYVQQLVDDGVITDEEAMNHHKSNVITRSLGDTSQKAKADVSEYDIENGQIVLLCSDGLCGVCKDEEIGGIIEEECSDLHKCKESLTSAALAAGGSDNITISLLQIHKDDTQIPLQGGKPQKHDKINKTTVLASIVCICLLVTLLYAGFSIMAPKKDMTESVSIKLDNDTLSVNEKTGYHVQVIGDTVPPLNYAYNKNLIDINFKDSIISVKVSFTKDSTTYIKITCRDNPSLVDSVALQIIKAKISEDKDTEMEESNKAKSTTADNIPQTTDTTSYITSSPEKCDSVTESPDSTNSN